MAQRRSQHVHMPAVRTGTSRKPPPTRDELYAHAPARHGTARREVALGEVSGATDDRRRLGHPAQIATGLGLRACFEGAPGLGATTVLSDAPVG